MKLISLNIWGGHVLEPLLDFIKAQQDVDVFCLQEVYNNATQMISEENRQVSLSIFSEIARLLPEHQGFFRPIVEGIYGLAIFVKKTIDVLSEGELSIYLNPDYKGRGPTHSRNLQWLECQSGKQIYTIINVHGLWNGKGKTDSAEGLLQSQRIRQFMDSIKTPMLLCGDFNLRPDTKSMAMIEQGMNNLIKTFQVSSTRTSLYLKEEKFADYILLSKDLVVNDFYVMQEEVSDHAPLYLDFSKTKEKRSN